MQCRTSLAYLLHCEGPNGRPEWRKSQLPYASRSAVFWIMLTDLHRLLLFIKLIGKLHRPKSGMARNRVGRICQPDQLQALASIDQGEERPVAVSENLGSLFSF